MESTNVWYLNCSVRLLQMFLTTTLRAQPVQANRSKMDFTRSLSFDCPSSFWRPSGSFIMLACAMEVWHFPLGPLAGASDTDR